MFKGYTWKLLWYMVCQTLFCHHVSVPVVIFRKAFFFKGYILPISLPLHANVHFLVMICNLKLTIYVRFICNNSVLILKVLVKNKTSNINSNNIFCHMLSVTLRMTGALQKTSPGADGPSPITSFPLKSIYWI